MAEQNIPQSQAGVSSIQQPVYGFAGGQSGAQPTGSQPSQAVQQPPTQASAMQQNPVQQSPIQQNPVQQQPSLFQQIPAQQQQNPTQQSPAQQQQNPAQQIYGQQNPTQQSQITQNPAQQNPFQQNPAQQQQSPVTQNPVQGNVAQQNPQGIERQSGGLQQPQAGQSWYQSTLTGTQSAASGEQSTGQVASQPTTTAPSPQPFQSQQPQGAGQPQFDTPTSTGPYGSQSAMMQSPTMAPIQGPSVQSPVSEFSASETGGAQLQMAAGPQLQSTAAQQAPAPTSGNSYEQAVAQELRAAVDGLSQLANVAEWAGPRLAQQGNADASRACEDVHDRAHVAADFILRGSPFAASAASELQATIGGAIQELQRHSSSEAREVLAQAQQASQQLDRAIARLNPAGTAQ
jgi:hypothetical protein